MATQTERSYALKAVPGILFHVFGYSDCGADVG